MRPCEDEIFEFSCNDREVITVEVTSTGTVPMVRFTLDELSWPGGSFTLDKSARNPSRLQVFVTFSNPTGGEYAITVRGGGCSGSKAVVRQSGKSIASRFYTFNVV